MSAPGQLIPLRSSEDARGKLVSVEALRDVPFAIERVYYIVAHEGAARGFHAHKTLEQLMICVSGSCRIILDDGSRRVHHALDRPDQGLIVGPMIWREMHEFSKDCVLLVLASAPYDEEDYIRDYETFATEVGKAA